MLIDDDSSMSTSSSDVTKTKRDTLVSQLIFTDYNVDHTTWEYDTLSAKLKCKFYALYSEEICPSTGRAHFQGYLQLEKRKRFSQLIKLIPKVNFKQAFRSYQENKYYIHKSRPADLALAASDPIKYPYPHSFHLIHEIGELLSTGSGSRNDLKEMVEFCKTARSTKELIEHDGSLYCQFRQGLKDIRREYQPIRTGPPTVYWFCGPTGSGKSRTAYEMAKKIDPDHEPYRKNPQTKFWDGYDCQKCVIFEDFRHDQLPFAYLLQLLDRYPCLVDIKGTSSQFTASHIFITCPNDPRAEYTGTNHSTNEHWSRENIDQLLRRITQIRHFAAIKTVSIDPEELYVDLNETPDSPDSPTIVNILKPIKRILSVSSIQSDESFIKINKRVKK